jgi:hypothetical protein
MNLGTLPRLVRFGVSASLRTAEWGAGTTARTVTYMVRAAATGQSPSVVIDDATDYLRRAIGVGETISTDGVGGVVEAVEEVGHITDWIREEVVGFSPLGRGHRGERQMSLQEMFAALLDASADVDYHYEGHPAYFRLLQELAPDEARILRLFAEKGPQPALDVRTKRPLGVGTKLLAPGITMIGAYAGCADKTRVPAYLNNLNRLGLIWFSREMLPNEDAYHLLEAQPEVLEAFKGQKISTVLRSIELTAFGRNLCALVGLMPPQDINVRVSVDQVSKALPAPDAR